LASAASAPRRRVFALFGPTASGKSRLALELAARLPVEIVSADSAQVYRGLNIGTAKPDAAERERVPHHLLDLVDPHESYSTGRWREDALNTIETVFSRNKIPLIVGGTMLYYRALAEGLDELPQADLAVRREIDADAARRGWPALHADLAKIDPPSALRIAPNDEQRIQRALEVFRLTGTPLSGLHGRSKAALPFELRGFALLPPDRAILHRRIEERFDSMLRQGLVDEIEALRKKFELTAGMPSMRAVGYRQVWEMLEGKTAAREMRERAVAATRQLAKRQITWLRSFRDTEAIETNETGRAFERLLVLLDPAHI
jgi:tRNA dimethylallyltransferase